jgi:ABC-2 type transport system ATP-binding protein
MNEVALEASGLGMRYGHTWAIRDCTFSLEKGRIAGLVGPNGAGKTTLIHLSVGLLRPATGQVLVFGLSPTSQAEKILPMIGYVDQERPLYRSFSV